MLPSAARALIRPLTRAASTGITEIKTLGVVGVGQMGAGIAQVAAQTAKCNVLLFDQDKVKLEKSLKLIGMFSRFCGVFTDS